MMKKPVLLILLVFFCLEASAATCTSISQHGITWTLDKAYDCGQFVNGEWWVKTDATGTVKITQITPAPTCATSTGRNGTMVNPRFGKEQGYDARSNYYNATLCHTPTITLNAGDTIISSTSLASYNSGQKTYIEDMAILTIVDIALNENSFRPPYTRPERIATSQDPWLYSYEDIDWTKLPKLPKTPSTPSIEESAAKLGGVRLEHDDSSTQPFFYPQYANTYGREIGGYVSEISLQLLLDYTNEEKKHALVNLVQYGIDVYGITMDGKTWDLGAGMRQGRKWPILFTGIILNEQEFLDVPRRYQEEIYPPWGLNYVFQEDAQTYYYDDDMLYDGCVNIIGEPITCDLGEGDWKEYGIFRIKGEKGWIDKTNGGEGDFVLWRIMLRGYIGNYLEHEQKYPEYWTDDGGIPSMPYDPQDGSNSDCRSDAYRRSCASSDYVGYALAARLMGAMEIWDHPAFFDYVDRWMEQDDSNARQYFLTNSCNPARFINTVGDFDPMLFQGYTYGGPFVREMWEAHRGPACYDGECNGDETYDTCPVDCFQGMTECTGSDKHCGTFPDCQNCNLEDKCIGETLEDHYCTGTNCEYINDDCTDCTCTCGGYNKTETTDNSNCSDGKDNDCDGQTDQQDPGCKTQPENLKVWLRFEGNMQDSSGNENHAQCNGNTCPTYTPTQGHDNTGAYTFDGVDDYMSLGNSKFDMDKTNQYTITAWLKRQAQVSSLDAITRRGAFIFPFSLEFSGSKIRTATRTIDGGASYLFSNASVQNNVWTHVAVTFESGSRAIYINGQPDNSDNLAGNLRIEDQETTLGRYPESATTYFNGTLDEIKIYDKALTAEEINAIYLGTGEECIDLVTLMSHITQWKEGSESMVSLMDKISRWKAGTGC